VACAFLVAEGNYLQRAVSLAVASREIDTNGLTLFMVEDAFYVLLKSFHRSVRTRNATLVVAPLLNQLTDAVREIVRPALLRRLNLSGPAEPTNSDFLVASNSLECAAYYCRKLRDVVAADFAEHFASLTPLAEVALGELEALASLFESHASDAIEQLAASLMPTGWLLIEFADMDFRIGNGGDAAENALRSAFDEKLLAPLGVALSSLVVRLRSTNGQTLVRQLSTALASQIERAAFQKRFDEVGAMLFSEQMRRLSDELSLVADTSVRNEFSRVAQLAFLLNAGSVQEAAALLVSHIGSMVAGTARLSLAEGAVALSRRVEFDRTEVQEVLSSLGLGDAEDV